MKWTVPILMLLLLVTTFSKGLVWLQYQGNKEFISKNLCINKFKPQLHCKGTCQLKKKMAEEQEKSSAPAPKLKAAFDETAILIITDHSQPDLEVETEFLSFEKKSAYKSPVFSVFHPPA